MHLDVSEIAHGVTPEEALAWWTDYREGRSDHAFFPGERRRILGRADDGTVTMEDKAPLFHEITTARTEPGRVVLEGVNTISRFAGSYGFAAVEDGTRIHLDVDIELRPFLRWTSALARPLGRAFLRADLRAHIKELVRDLGQGPCVASA